MTEQRPASQAVCHSNSCSSTGSGSSPRGSATDLRKMPDLNETNLLAATIATLRATFSAEDGGGSAGPVQRDCESQSLPVLRLPALSLHHETHFADRKDRKQVEEYAACLLSRPLVVGGREEEEGGEPSALPSAHQQQPPRQLLENAAESFAVLVDCRLRAYATFLARHAISLAHKCESEGVLSIEQKVSALLDAGKSIRATAMALQFQLVDGEAGGGDVETEGCPLDDDDNSNEPEPENSNPSASWVPLSLRVDMELELTRPSGTKEVLPVLVEAPGAAKVVDAHTVEITLDTRHLLEAMIQQASRVVAAVVEIANTSSLLAESKLSRSSSFLAMPPPSQNQAPANHLHRLRRHDGPKSWLQAADGACAAAAPCNGDPSTEDRHPVVSPDTRAVVAAPGVVVPVLDLLEEGPPTACGDDLDALTPEDCADIVDGIFADWWRTGPTASVSATANEASGPLPPPSKKPRLIA